MPTTLALKLILAPLLIGGSTLAGRRWGPALGGWLVGLPLTSGPVALFLVLDHGSAFGARAAGGMLAGTISQVAFALAYRRLAGRGPWTVAAVSTAAPVLGAQLSGLLSPFPFFGATLAVFAHHRDGGAAAGAVLRGLLCGLFAPAAFFFVLATLLVSLGPVVAFAAAAATALVAQGVTLAALRR